MELLPPRLFGPLSACSRAAAFENAVPGATIVLLRTRGGATQDVGQVTTTLSHGVVPLNPGEEFAADDLITAYQHTGAGFSPWQPDAIRVQRSDDKFNPPQVLTHLYACSPGFSVGAMRPGTRVEVLEGGSVIATGEAANGTAHVRVVHPFGLPLAGAQLTLRQRVCPKPPPPGGAPEWVIDTPLPVVEPLLIREGHGGILRAPKIVAGLTACSRSVQVTEVVPGAEVIIADRGGAWWASRGPSDATELTIELPVGLEEGREVEVRQEVGRRCEMEPERRTAVVGPRATLPRPQLFTIHCHTSPTVHMLDLKVGADIEFEVVFQGQTELFRGVASHAGGTFPAPPMPVGAAVRVRQGECDNWSDWSDPPQTAQALAESVHDLRIDANLFQCQNTVPVNNVHPLTGTLRIVSSVSGVLAQISDFGNRPAVAVAPSLILDHEIWVEHEVCGVIKTSPSKRVLALADPGIGDVVGPLYDGDTTVTVKDITCGAYVEIWDQSHLRTSGYAPFYDGGKVDVTFSSFGQLRSGQHIYAKFWHCGRYGRNEGKPVHYRKPELDEVRPTVAYAGSGALEFTAVGRHFRQGAFIFATGGSITTTFISATELRGTIPAHFIASPMTQQVLVRNPDNQMSGLKNIAIVAQPPPPPALLNLSLVNESGGHFAIVSVAWTVWQQTAAGFGAPLSATGTSATVQPPANGQYHIHAAVAAKRIATDEDELAEFRGTATGPGGVKTLVVVWSGSAMTKTFRLFHEGQPDGLYNAVVILQS